MSEMSDLHIEMIEDLQTDEPTDEEIANWLEDRSKQMQGDTAPPEETDSDQS